MLKLGNEFGVAKPAPCAQGIDKVVGDCIETIGALGAEDRTASVLETIDGKVAGQHRFDRSGISTSDADLLRPQVTTHRILPPREAP